MALHKLNEMQINVKKTIYKVVFYLSTICILLKKRHCSSRERKIPFHRNLYKIINVFVTLILFAFTVCGSISFLLHCMECSVKEVLLLLCSFAVRMLFHIHLHKYLNKKKYFEKKISRISYSYCENLNIPSWTLIWGIFTISLNIFAFGYNIKLLITTDMLKKYIFGYEIKDTFWKFIISITFSYFNNILLNTPVNIFAFSYVMICYEVKELVLSFYMTMQHLPRYNNNKLTFIYKETKSAICFIDNNVGFLVFLSFIYNGSLLYIGLTSFIELSDLNYSI